jgi:hypothetical protein
VITGKAQANYQQSKAIHRWQPWKQSTGPKICAEKQRVRMNSVTHGLRTQSAMAEQENIRLLIADAAKLSRYCLK